MNTNSQNHPQNEQSAIQQVALQIETFLRDVWRYRWMSVLAAWIIAFTGWTVVYFIPDKYEANARILVDTDSILRPLLEGLAVETDIQSRVNMMTRTILSRPNLEKLIRATDMDINIKTEQEKENLFVKLRRQINIKLIRSNNADTSRAANRDYLYAIGYANNDPVKARAVVQELINIFVESTLGGNRQDSDVAQKFLSKQLVDYEKKLVDAEQKLMEFKRKNVGLIIGRESDYFTNLSRMQTEYEQAQFDLSQAKQRRDELKKQLDEIISTAAKPDSNSIPTSTDARIDELKTQLDSLLIKYTDEHPDVAELKQTIKSLEEQKKKELESIATGNTSSAVLESSPVYQELRVSLGQASADIATAQGRVKEFNKRINTLKEKIEILPKIEAELASLNRDYQINKSQYDSLLSRRESARISQDAENAGDQVKFQIIEPAHVPSKPSFPNRVLFNSAVLVVAIGGGLGLIFLIGQFNPVVHHQKSLRTLTGYPVFGSVSMIRSEASLVKRKNDIVSYASSMLALVLLYAVIVVIQILS